MNIKLFIERQAEPIAEFQSSAAPIIGDTLIVPKGKDRAEKLWVVKARQWLLFPEDGGDPTDLFVEQVNVYVHEIPLG